MPCFLMDPVTCRVIALVIDVQFEFHQLLSGYRNKHLASFQVLSLVERCNHHQEYYHQDSFIFFAIGLSTDTSTCKEMSLKEECSSIEDIGSHNCFVSPGKSW
jgi:hypothetical protein